MASRTDAAEVRVPLVPPLVAEALDSLMPSPQQWTIIVVMLAGAAVVYLRLRKRRPKDWSAKPHREDRQAAASSSKEVGRDLNQLVAELRELTGKLDRSIDEADKRIHALRILIDEAKRVTTAAPAEPPKPTPPVGWVGPDQPSVEPRPAAPPEPPLSPAEQRHHRIYELADRGLSSVQIAAQLGQSTGEVELILNLRRSGARG